MADRDDRLDPPRRDSHIGSDHRTVHSLYLREGGEVEMFIGGSRLNGSPSWLVTTTFENARAGRPRTADQTSLAQRLSTCSAPMAP